MNLYQPTITGSLKISGSVEITGSLIGSAVTASYATNLTVSGTITAQTLVVQTVTSSVIYSSGSNMFGNDITNTQIMTGSLLMTGSLNITGGNQVIRSNTNQVLLLSSSFSTGLYTSYQSGSTVIGDIGNGSQVFSAGDVTAFGVNARDSRKLQLGAAQTVVMTISGNNVGIGTTSPTDVLHINGSGVGINITGGNNRIYFSGSRALEGNGTQLQVGEGHARTLFQTTVGGTVMTITGSNVGIGTIASYSHNLCVNGAVGLYSTAGAGKWHIQYNGSADGLNFVESAVADYRLFLKAGGNVGIGTGTPADKLEIYSGTYNKIKTYFPSTYVSGFLFSDYNGGIKYDAGSDRLTLFANYAGDAEITFDTVSTERMRIANTGDVLINTTSTASAYAWLHVRGASKGIAIQSSVDNNYRAIYSTSNILYFWNGSNEGGLNASGVWFNASDVTIKKDIEDIKYGLNEVLQLRPRSYKMIEDDSDQIGFIAQEIEEILPELVSTSERGMKGLSYGQITAVLAKAIQELKADNDAIRAELAALKS